MPEHRVELDFVITFRNGGGLRGEGFRLDIPGDDISDADAGALLVRDLGLSMVDQVRIVARRIVGEPHRRRPSVPTAGAASRRLVELSHVVRDGNLTGPVSRGDAGTVRKHLSHLPPESVPAYLALARRTADRAVAAGRLRPQDATSLMDLLAQADAPASVPATVGSHS